MSTSKFSIDDVALAIPTLDREKVVAFAGAFLQITSRERADDLSAHDVLSMLLYGWLDHLGFLPETQSRALLKAASPALTEFATKLDGGASNVLFTVHVVDRRWAVWPSREVWLDLLLEKDVKMLPSCGVTTITCDVTALYLESVRRIETLRSRSAHSVPG